MRWIAGYNLAKGLLLLLLAVGCLGFLHKDIDGIVGHWMSMLGLDLENRHIAALLSRLDLVTDRQLGELSGVTFLFAGVFITEGTGLLLRQQWAKYLTVFVTASFIPFELFEIAKHCGPGKMALLVVNVAIVWLLVAILRREARHVLA